MCKRHCEGFIRGTLYPENMKNALGQHQPACYVIQPACFIIGSLVDHVRKVTEPCHIQMLNQYIFILRGEQNVMHFQIPNWKKKLLMSSSKSSVHYLSKALGKKVCT